MPKPRKGEKQHEYVSRFVSDPTMRHKHPDRAERLAIAYSEYERHKKGSKK